jgi:hypothetical protein
MTETLSLKLYTLKHIIENLDTKDIDLLFNDIEINSLIDIRRSINKSLNKIVANKYKLYIVTDDCGNFRLSDIAINFMKKYYPEFNMKTHCRHDPILVLLIALFGEYADDNWISGLRVNIVEFDLFQNYQIHINHNKEYINIVNSDDILINILHRPDDLYYNIKQYAEENKISLKFIDNFPHVGEYRLFDV